MSNYSEDDWSLVSEDEDVQSNMSFDEVDPEPEVQAEFDPEVEVVKQSRRDSMKLKMNERSLALAKQQAQLTTEYQDNLKAISNSLRRENAQLSAQNAVLRGDDEALEVRSLDELEELESILARVSESEDDEEDESDSCLLRLFFFFFLCSIPTNLFERSFDRERERNRARERFGDLLPTQM
eukprot:jgi/Phyca11/19101/fgenesh1_pg.PHYCAscaffold_43_\